MLVIRCPWCGERAESEFNFGGQAGIERPANPEHLSDEQWGDYLFMRKNPLGIHREQWVHTHGCRRWFIAERDTRHYQFKSVEKIGAPGKEQT
ncbi:sarcosine oxidase delta subunit family protein [Advenella kashmirensis WT001]|uniref:Sarcosine oxidase delta subunit family protein n=1 Tax=Advenella kashmirensis (strain DSM 17095 / LMG 22695 / WT001) TaxID=1036672 RepID=I3UF86_ADVKW|nr:sarcosine oxidase subunit delta [Advenella kashmirensis]AFK63674.1 sarcosine oxidase delta subunit family protein [Advenella kashmirensis WT001]